MPQLQLKTFRITDEASEEALNSFLRGKKAYHWSVSYADNGWNILMVYEQEKPQQNRHSNHAPQERHEHHAPKRNNNENSGEHTPDLPAEQIPLYDAIRRWRNNHAREENIKPYVLFNNKQIEAIIKAKPADLEALKPMVAEMAPEHFDKYAGELLGMVNAT